MRNIQRTDEIDRKCKLEMNVKFLIEHQDEITTTRMRDYDVWVEWNYLLVGQKWIQEEEEEVEIIVGIIECLSD